eukprot:UN25173
MKLHSIDSTLLPAFSRLNDCLHNRSQGQYHCCMVLIDKWFPQNYDHITKGKECDTIHIHFPKYDQNEIIKILQLRKHPQIRQTVWNNLVKYIVCYFNHTSDLVDFTHILASVNEIVEANLETREMQESLLEKIRPTLHKLRKDDQNNKYNANRKKTVINEDFNEERKECEEIFKIKESSLNKHNDNMVHDVALSEASKIMLIAAFVASHNPAATDRRLFVNEE